MFRRFRARWRSGRPAPRPTPALDRRLLVQRLEDRLAPAVADLSALAADPNAYDPSHVLVRLRPGVADPAGLHILDGARFESALPLVPGLWEVRLADGVPMAIQHVYLSLDLFPNFLDEALPSSLYFWFAMKDLMPTWGEDSVNAGIATEEEAEYLELDPGAPVLHISRRAFCRENVVEVTRSVYRADRYTLWVPVLRPEHLR